MEDCTSRISLLIDPLMSGWNDLVLNNNQQQQQQNNNNPLVSGRSNASLVYEALIEYCRVIFDLFYDSKTVSIFTTVRNAWRLNDRTRGEQSLKHIIQSITTINLNDDVIHQTTTQNEPDFLQALEYTLISLIEDIDDNNTTPINISSDDHMIALSTSSTNHSLILLLPQQNNVESTFYKVGDSKIDLPKQVQTIIDKINQQSSRQIKCDLFIIKMIIQPSLINSNFDFKYIKQSNQLNIIMKEVYITSLYQLLSDISTLQFDLSRISVTGIPMKESSQNSTRVIYDVILLYKDNNKNRQKQRLAIALQQQQQQQQQEQQPPQKDKKRLADSCGNSKYDKYNRLMTNVNDTTHFDPPLTVRWRTTEKKLVFDTMTFSSSHRVTPLILTSNPSVCLMKHICSGKTVFLSPPDQLEHITHILALHEQEVHLHFLHTPMDIAQLIPILECYTTDVSKYRTSDFSDMIEASILQHRKSTSPQSGSNNQQPPQQQQSNSFLTTHIPNPFYQAEDENSLQQFQVKTPRIVEKYTRYFPWIKADTLFFSDEQCDDLKMLLDTVKRLLLKDILSDESLEEVSKLIFQLFKMTQSNDQQLFPQLKSNANLRKEYYKKLWIEFYTFAKQCQQTKQHFELFNIIEKLYNNLMAIPTPQQLPSPPQQPIPQQPPQTTQQQQTLNKRVSSPQTVLPTQPPQQQQQQPQYSGLYQNLQQNIAAQQQQQAQSSQTPANDNTLWSQFDKQKKQVKEDELKAERDRQMSITNPKMELPSQNDDRKRKFQHDTPAKPNNFFNSFWDNKNVKTPIELDGRVGVTNPPNSLGSTSNIVAQ